MPDRCTNGACDSTDAPIPIGNGRVKCMTCYLTVNAGRTGEPWDDPKYTEVGR